MGDDQDDGFTGWLKIKIQNDKVYAVFIYADGKIEIETL